jgi:hypothetical protein
MKLPVASHTMLKTFDNCPYKGFRMYIAKDLPKAEPSEAMRVGQEVHKALAAYISRGRSLPKEYEKYEALASPFIGLKPRIEVPLAMDRFGNLCGFFDDYVYVRGYGDVVVVRDNAAAIFDWKTGRKDEDPGELKIHAMMLKAAYPELSQVTGHFVWLKNVDTSIPSVGKKHDCSDFGATWRNLECQMDEIENMLIREHFPKQPNPLCSWCPVMDCMHNKVKRREVA